MISRGGQPIDTTSFPAVASASRYEAPVDAPGFRSWSVNVSL